MAEEKNVDQKENLKELGKSKRKIKYGERKQVEIIKSTKHYKVGKIINPHVVMAENLIKQKVAKAI
jgi:hypothetical protein